MMPCTSPNLAKHTEPGPDCHNDWPVTFGAFQIEESTWNGGQHIRRHTREPFCQTRATSTRKLRSAICGGNAPMTGRRRQSLQNRVPPSGQVLGGQVAGRPNNNRQPGLAGEQLDVRSAGRCREIRKQSPTPTPGCGRVPEVSARRLLPRR